MNWLERDWVDSLVRADWPRYGLAVYSGGGNWHVLAPFENVGLTSSPPLGMVRHPQDDGFFWAWPEVPDVARLG